MEKFNQSIKKSYRSFGLVTALIIGFTGGIIFQSFNLIPAGLRNSLASNTAGMMPEVAAANGVTTTICGLTQMPANDAIRGIMVGINEYNSASNAYQNAHPDNPAGSATWGGIIGKEYLMAIINSLSSTETNVRFCFATEANQKTSIYFKGGVNDPVTGKTGTFTFVAKTGTSADAYCPTHCSN